MPLTSGPQSGRKTHLEAVAGVKLATFYKSADTVNISLSGGEVEVTAFRKQGYRGVYVPTENVAADDDPENVGKAILKAFDWFDR